MSRRKIALISAIIDGLFAASFFVGMLYSPYGRVGMYPGAEPMPPIVPGALTVATPTATGPIPTPATRAVDVLQERMVIYNAYVSLETPNIEAVLAKIRLLAESMGGYVAGSSRSSFGTQAVAEITIRVPKDKFRGAVQEIEGYGKVLDESTTSEDVTQQYIDVKARLDNLQRQEQRLREILDLARTVDEILKVENELSRVRGEIDSLQGQINYLERNVEMSLLWVRLVEPAPPFTPPGMDWGETFQTALSGLFFMVRGLIVLVVSFLPLIIIAAGAYYLYRRTKRKKQMGPVAAPT